jgi:hypothetical protein
VTLTAPLPAGLKVLRVTQTGGTYDKAGHRAAIPTLAAGAEAVFTVRVRATQTGLYRLTGTAQGTDAEDEMGNNRSAVLLRVTADPPAPPARTVASILASAFRR